MIYIFWSAVFVLIYIYWLYPALIYILSLIFPRELIKEEYFPFVTIVTAAYNEEKTIGKFLENKLSLNYPADLLQIMVISDASSDNTDRIVNSYADKRIKFSRQNTREGKTAALNRGVKEARGEIVVFCDANSILHKDAIKYLISNFSDDKIGYVTGKLVYGYDHSNLEGFGSNLYMKYENWLRVYETKLGSIVGANGGIDAIRKSLYISMPKNMIPDFYLPLDIVERGFRSVYEPRAILFEDALTNPQDEIKMRIRVALRAFHAIWKKLNLLNVFKYRIFSFQFFSHKILRYLAGIFQIILIFSNIIMIGKNIFYYNFFIFQIFFYILAIVGWLTPKYKLKVFTAPYYLCLLNFSSLFAFIKFLLGENLTVWNPRKGN